MSEAKPEKFEFQAEIRQLLDIVIHSLYTEKEIFVRELVSNASDALEKLRHLQLTEKSVFDDRLELEINITTDDAARTITIQDYGIGMTREELVKNLGTIAHSGSKAFLEAIRADGDKNAALIGQFGVGFYSAFMVAESVTVYSHSWKKDEPGHVWKSDGTGSFEIEEVDGQRRGTKVVVRLKEDCADFATASRIEGLLKHYSAFVSVPILLNGNRINTIQALWLRSKDEIKEEEYTEFYKFQAHASDEPRFRLHFTADAPLQINTLLFVPGSNPEKLGLYRMEPAVALYCRKVLIDASPKDLLPEWLRFLKGVVDSEDLPLNISRETMQDKALLAKLGKVLTKRFLKLLEEESTSSPDKYDAFFREFGIFLKEGAAMDFSNREGLLKLLRFESSRTENGKSTSLADYVSRMGEEQKDIYFLVGTNRQAIESSPSMEGFRARNLEVLFCTEPADEYVMQNAHEFDGRKLVPANRSDLVLPGNFSPAEGEKLPEEELQALLAWIKESLGDRVTEVKVSDRLVDSPALAMDAEGSISPQMRRMMKALNPDAPDMQVRIQLEINPRNPIISRLAKSRSESPEKASLIAGQILDNALLSAGLLEDPAAMVSRMNKLLEKVG